MIRDRMTKGLVLATRAEHASCSLCSFGKISRLSACCFRALLPTGCHWKRREMLLRSDCIVNTACARPCLPLCSAQPQSAAVPDNRRWFPCDCSTKKEGRLTRAHTDNNMAAVSINGVDAKQPATAFVLYRTRWLVLAVFSLVSMTNEIIWISLSSVTSIVQVYYGVSSVAVNWLSMVYMLFYVFVVPASYILDRFGLKFTIVLGTCLNGLGSAFRCIGANRDGFAFTFAGNIMAALAQCFILFIPPRLAAVWFGEHERATASSIGILMNMFGVALGFLMGTMVPSDQPMDSGVAMGMHRVLISQAVFCTVLAVLAALLVRAHPKTPPSMSQALVIDAGCGTKKQRQRATPKVQLLALSPCDDGHSPGTDASTSTTPSIATPPVAVVRDKSMHPSFLHSCVILSRSLSFHLLLQGYGLYFGLFAAYNTVLNQMVTTRYPGRETDIGYMGFASVMFGLLGIFLSGVWIDRTRRYKAVSVFIFGGCVLTLLSFTLLLTYGSSFSLLFACFCAFGFFSYPYISAGLEHAAETTYPVPEGTSSGILLLAGNMYGIALTYALGAVIEAGGADTGGYIMVAGYTLGVIVVACVNAPLKRTLADHAIASVALHR